jgi:hypothetical protein
VVAHGYDAIHIQWLCNNLLSDLGPRATIRGCTEHRRTTHTGANYMFRAHPSFRGGKCWHDWALFQWTESNNVTNLVPGHIVTFLYLEDNDIGQLQHNGHVVGSEPGLYVMVETLEDPLPTSQKYSRIVMESSKNLTRDQNTSCRNAHIPLTQSNTYLLPVDTIYESIAAIPNLGAQEGDHLFIRPTDDWGFAFSKLLTPFFPQEAHPAAAI